MDLEPGEQIIFQGHPSWRSIVSFYLKGALLIALAAAVAALVSAISEDGVRSSWVTVTIVVGAGLVVIVGLVKRIFTTYTITNRRLHIRRGIVSRHTQETHLHRTQNVNTRQTFFDRLLQVGTVDFDTAGSGDYDFSFVGVSDPDDVVQAVNRAQSDIEAQQPS
jgi:uncharacterized membrane protein YdbT with pleckstrin-like domain